jgi:hypothetical protein
MPTLRGGLKSNSDEGSELEESNVSLSPQSEMPPCGRLSLTWTSTSLCEGWQRQPHPETSQAAESGLDPYRCETGVRIGDYVRKLS